MTEFRARIGRVRMKAGGADVRVIDRMVDNGNGQDWRGTICASARGIADIATDDEPLAGYIIIGMFAGGAASVGYRYDPAACHIPRALLPSWVAEVIRRDLITERECHQVFDEKFEWREG